MDFRLILKGILKEKFKLINSLMKSRAILESLKKDEFETVFVLYILDRESLVRYPFYVLQGLREEKNE